MPTPHTERNTFRKLEFESIAACRAELQRVLEADAAGTLQAVGNWTPGQILAHIAAWIEYGYEGYPLKKVPFFVQWLLRLKFKQILRSGMSPGVRIPGVQGGTTGADDMSTTVAYERLQHALDRLEKGEEATYVSPAFGDMSHEQRVALNLRHAELHLGFLQYPSEL